MVLAPMVLAPMVQSACDVQLHGAPESSSHAVRLYGGGDVALHVASGSTAPPTARMHVTLRVCVPVGEHGAVVCACGVAEPAADARPRLHGDHGPAAHTATSLGHGKRLQGRDDAGGGCKMSKRYAAHADKQAHWSHPAADPPSSITQTLRECNPSACSNNAAETCWSRHQVLATQCHGFQHILRGDTFCAACDCTTCARTPLAAHADGSLGLAAPPDPGSDDMHVGGGAVDTPSDAASLVFRTQEAEQPLHG